MYIIRNIKIPYDLDNDENLKKAIEEKINRKIDSFKIYKKSIDARLVFFMFIKSCLIVKLIKKLGKN